MVKSGIVPRYYNKNKGENRMELDFVAEIGDDPVVIEVKSGKDCEVPSLTKASSVFKVDRRVMFEDMNVRISDDGVEHYPLYAAAFMDSMGGSQDIGDALWTARILSCEVLWDTMSEGIRFRSIIGRNPPSVF